MCTIIVIGYVRRRQWWWLTINNRKIITHTFHAVVLVFLFCRRWHIWNWCCIYCVRHWLVCCTVIRAQMATNPYKMLEICWLALPTCGTRLLCRECWNVSWIDSKMNFEKWKWISEFLPTNAVPTELAIVRKETFNSWYKARTYFLANTLTTTPIHVCAFLFEWLKPMHLLSLVWKYPK